MQVSFVWCLGHLYTHRSLFCLVRSLFCLLSRSLLNTSGYMGLFSLCICQWVGCFCTKIQITRLLSFKEAKILSEKGCVGKILLTHNIDVCELDRGFRQNCIKLVRGFWQIYRLSHWSDIFASLFKARSSKLARVFSMKLFGKRDVQASASSFGKSFSKMWFQIG